MATRPFLLSSLLEGESAFWKPERRYCVRGWWTIPFPSCMPGTVRYWLSSLLDFFGAIVRLQWLGVKTKRGIRCSIERDGSKKSQSLLLCSYPPPWGTSPYLFPCPSLIAGREGSANPHQGDNYGMNFRNHYKFKQNEIWEKGDRKERIGRRCVCTL